MDDCIQAAMLICILELRITGCRTNSYWTTNLNAKKQQSQQTVQYRSNVDDAFKGPH